MGVLTPQKFLANFVEKFSLARFDRVFNNENPGKKSVKKIFPLYLASYCTQIFLIF
jgi:hypothetical protein